MGEGATATGRRAGGVRRGGSRFEISRRFGLGMERGVAKGRGWSRGLKK